MWLIDTSNLRLKEILELENCKYAILSHTWEKDEVEFQEMRTEPRPASLLTKAGFLKIKQTCELAKEKGYDYAWVDTCCIDKASSAALSEAINSMFYWYKESSICFAYLSDLPINNFEHAESKTADLMKDCKWFTRGWTLQELIAPEELDFYDQEWNFRGSKKILRRELSRITGIDVDILEDPELLPTIPVGRRMSWASARRTTRVEDIAYCLFGIFGVNMPMIYGEHNNAFLRLQEEIAKSTNDLTLFAWTSQDASGVDRRPTHRSQQGNDLRGILAQSPAEFVGCGRLKISRDRIAPAKDFAMTNNGLRIETILGSSPDKEYVLALDCVNEDSNGQERLGIYLMKTENGFIRDRAYELFTTTDKAFWTGNRSTIYIARNLSNGLALRLRAQLLRSLNFHFHLSPKNTYTYNNIKARPLSLWDKNGKLFLTGNRQDFTAVIEFNIRPRWWRFVVVCGLIDTRSKKPRVTDLWDDDDSAYGGVTPWMAIFTDQDPAMKPQLDIIDKLKTGNNELWQLREKVLSWYLDDSGRLPVRKMAEQLKSAFDEDGEVSYNMSMITEPNQKGTPVFNLRIFISEVTRVRDASSTMADLGADEDAQHMPQQAPRWVPQPPPANAPEVNPFAPQPRRYHSDAAFPQGYGPGHAAPRWNPQYANAVPHAVPRPAYPRPGHTPRQWTDPAGSLEIQEFGQSNDPLYAILSHTWGDCEATFHEWRSRVTRFRKTRRPGFAKVLAACAQARRDGFFHIWVDTVCIDKTSSAELSEAINSMFKWYEGAMICYVYLADIPSYSSAGVDLLELMGKSRWFTRGWTLQELIAPYKVVFYSRSWTHLGTKKALSSFIAEVTDVNQLCICKEKALDNYSVAQRMSWAVDRSTTRPEDMAYCLLGIFGINLPLLYGEGKKAFIRLQEEILRASDDHSVLAFDAASSGHSLLADHPSLFRDMKTIQPTLSCRLTPPFAMTNAGLSMETPLIQTLSPHWIRDHMETLKSQICLRLLGKDGIYMRAQTPVCLLRRCLREVHIPAGFRTEIEDLTTPVETKYLASRFLRVKSVPGYEMNHALGGFGTDVGRTSGFMLTFPPRAGRPPARRGLPAGRPAPRHELLQPARRGVRAALSPTACSSSSKSRTAWPARVPASVSTWRQTLDSPGSDWGGRWMCALTALPDGVDLYDRCRRRWQFGASPDEWGHYHHMGRYIAAARTRVPLRHPVRHAVMVELVFDADVLLLEQAKYKAGLP
ncbi:hypothetical protein SLS53_007878 [Cytospora paraplurivora]|uniref:Heterokaryon incompatibility domain-containing protein n=1 Tax=Cytospora paraplurivora TaxID=2898453 RepID=A0AAN9U1Z0_9PEZI